MGAPRHRRGRRHPRLRARRIHGPAHGRLGVVVGPGGRSHRHSHVFQRGRDRPGGGGPARQGRGAWYGTRLHDVGHRLVASRDGDLAQGA